MSDGVKMFAQRGPHDAQAAKILRELGPTGARGVGLFVVDDKGQHVSVLGEPDVTPDLPAGLMMMAIDLARRLHRAPVVDYRLEEAHRAQAAADAEIERQARGVSERIALFEVLDAAKIIADEAVELRGLRLAGKHHRITDHALKRLRRAVRGAGEACQERMFPRMMETLRELEKLGELAPKPADGTPPPAPVEAEGLGPIERTERGFEIIRFADYFGMPCNVQASSLEESGSQPGSEAVWLGIESAATRMHLERELVRDLVEVLRRWVDTGTFRRPGA